MQMKNLLPAMLIAIDDQTIPITGNAFLFGNDFGDKQHVPGHFFIIRSQIIDRGNNFIRDNENVRGRSRIDVTERCHLRGQMGSR